MIVLPIIDHPSHLRDIFFFLMFVDVVDVDLSSSSSSSSYIEYGVFQYCFLPILLLLPIIVLRIIDHPSHSWDRV